MGNEFTELRAHWNRSHEAEKDQRASWRVPRMAEIEEIIAAMKQDGWNHLRASSPPKAGERVLCWDPGSAPFIGYKDSGDYRVWWAEVDGDIWPHAAPLMWQRSQDAQLPPPPERPDHER